MFSTAVLDTFKWPVNETDTEICLYLSRGECRIEDKCVRVHYRLPYKWQVLDKNGKTWTDLENETEIEKNFCDPANDVSPGVPWVHFTLMTCGGAPVRRLSTPSSVTEPAKFALTTKWLWYWKSDSGVWTEYGQEAMDMKLRVPLTSEKLEKFYQDGLQSEISTSSASHNYKLNLKDMYQQNTLFHTKREIRRRPRYISAQQVNNKLRCERSSYSSEEVPAHWDRKALPKFSYKRVPLNRTDKEFLVIEKLFKKTMPSFVITRIERNQNSSLWKMFQWQKEQMMEKNGGRDVDERLLFHGTDSSLVDVICDQNFDWRISGKHATLYGKGSYFARDASFSDAYSNTSDDSKKMMFIARVLVGNYTCGQSDFVRPPKSYANSYYDSCVDNEGDPSIFVIFEKYQIYPEFIIEYGPESIFNIKHERNASDSFRCLIS